MNAWVGLDVWDSWVARMCGIGLACSWDVWDVFGMLHEIS